VKTIPTRMCIATRAMYPKEELIRIVNNNGIVIVDIFQKIPGRGAYLLKTKEALQILLKKRLLTRALKINVPDSIYQEIERIINE